MRITSFVRSALLGAVSLTFAAAAHAQVFVSVSVGAPPALPVYDQPPLPAAGYIWTPGYWAYDPADGYFWVPGTWVEPPEPGLLWTPGYWAWGSNGYDWNAGYWGPAVGFYGGIDYGYGYGGAGYQGGYWNHGAFYYNRSVTRISNTTNITNVYNKTVINNTTRTNVSYNGGTGGTMARPTPAEQTASHQRHIPPTSAQTQQEHTASTNRDQWASVNRGKPAVEATPKPGAFSGQDVVKGGHVTRSTSAGEVSNNNRPEAGRAKPASPAETRKAPPPVEARKAPPAEARKAPPAAAAHPNAEEHHGAENQPKAATQPKADHRGNTEGQPKASSEPKAHNPPPSDQRQHNPPSSEDQKRKSESPPANT